MFPVLILLTYFSCVNGAQVIYNKGYETPKLTSIVGHNPPWNVNSIYFYMNEISHVPAGYFVNMSSLGDIWLDANLISSIDDNAFSGVPTVFRIRLEENQLSVIGELTFAGLYNLINLELEKNQIHLVEPGAFHDLTCMYTQPHMYVYTTSHVCIHNLTTSHVCIHNLTCQSISLFKCVT